MGFRGCTAQLLPSLCGSPLSADVPACPTQGQTCRFDMALLRLAVPRKAQTMQLCCHASSILVSLALSQNSSLSVKPYRAIPSSRLVLLDTTCKLCTF